jgi:hypothetical protein
MKIEDEPQGSGGKSDILGESHLDAHGEYARDPLYHLPNDYLSIRAIRRYLSTDQLGKPQDTAEGPNKVTDTSNE